MIRVHLLFVTMLLGSTTAAAAQQCPRTITVPTPSGKLALPQGQRARTAIDVVEADSTTRVDIGTTIRIERDTIWFTAEAVRALWEKQGSGATRQLRLTGGPGAPCLSAFRFRTPVQVPAEPVADDQDPEDVNTSPEPDGATRDRLPGADITVAAEDLPATERIYSAGQCQAAGRQWAVDLYRRANGSGHTPTDQQLRRAKFTAVVALPGSGICYASRPYGVTGDPIHVAVFTDDRDPWERARVNYAQCAAESAVPAILGSTALKDVAVQLQNTQWSLVTYAPRECYNTDVNLTVTSVPTAGGTAVSEAIRIEQAQRYRAGIQLGSLFTNQHERTYGVQRVTDTVPRIYDKGPVHEGPEYFASAVIYGLPNYFLQRNYPGRDVIHERGFFDRIGGIFGLGLPNPRDRIVLGSAFEVLPGFNITYTHQWHRGTRLAAGLAVDSIFRGAEDTIPKQTIWRRTWNWGLSLDATYVAQLLLGKAK